MPGVDVSHQSIGLDLSIPERDETGHGNRPNRPAVKLLNDLGRGQSGSPLARPPDFLPTGPYSRTSMMRPAVCRSMGEDPSLRLDPRIGSPPPVFRRLPLGESSPGRVHTHRAGIRAGPRRLPLHHCELMLAGLLPPDHRTDDAGEDLDGPPRSRRRFSRRQEERLQSLRRPVPARSKD